MLLVARKLPVFLGLGWSAFLGYVDGLPGESGVRTLEAALPLGGRGPEGGTG